MCKFALDLIRIKELILMCDECLRVTGLSMTGRIRADVKTDEVDVQVRVCWTGAREHAMKACVNVTRLYAASV